ncbi:MAG: dihydropyrimidinase, partial [Caldilineaceae bacterium]|nr:dihydropyrimidinase [Caldilineaceae bacterium]
MYSLVVKNGLLVTGDGLVEADLAIHGERIAAIGHDLAGAEIIDATDCYV